jgi:hypothetical protein
MLPHARARLACAVAISLIVAAGIAASPAGAADKTAETFTAIASWQTGGPTASNVSLQVTETEDATPVLFFFVSQEFCDTAHNQEVFRSFNGAQPASAVLFKVGSNLSGARLGARGIPMTGTEQRIDGCTTGASRTGVAATSLGSFDASILAAWVATAPKVDVQPGIKARDGVASAFEFSRGPLNLGLLGASQFAQLRKSTVPTP